VAASVGRVEEPPEESARPLSAELEGAATTLYREHFAFVWRNARRLGCEEDWVDDAVHEIFVVATRRLGEFEGRSSERTWLFAITFRVVQRMRRDRTRQREHLVRYARELPPATADASQDTEAAEYLRYLLGHLPQTQQLVLILAELEGFTATEIAETLGIPLGTVHSRLRAAKQHLTRLIERESPRDERPEP
jgi:RNA polymerase sigma-70 factor, ECF subfamily